MTVPPQPPQPPHRPSEPEPEPEPETGAPFPSSNIDGQDELDGLDVSPADVVGLPPSAFAPSPPPTIPVVVPVPLPEGACGAFLPDGRVCRRPRAAGSPRCTAHTPAAVGRYRRVLNLLAADYDAALADADLLSLRHEIAVLDAVTTRLLAHLEALERQVDADAGVDAGPDADTVDVALARLRGQLADLLDRRRKLAESERARLRDLAQLIPRTELLAIVQAILDAIRLEVTDDDVRDRLLDRIRTAVRDRGLPQPHVQPQP